ncbi:MAG TPA: hypothetical protein VLG71_01885 [Candidatus Limnocylindria bacterium]|nr:hypothetical protein [Candidatus Limnocylindria bacterium]
MQEVAELKVMVQELQQRVAKQEQKLLSLEREIAEKEFLAQEVDDYQVVDSYKEPILQRAHKNQLFSTPKKGSCSMMWRSLSAALWALNAGAAAWLAYLVWIQ